MSGITHAKVSPHTDQSDLTLVLPSDWNDIHIVTFPCNFGDDPSGLNADNNQYLSQSAVRFILVNHNVGGIYQRPLGLFNDDNTAGDQEALSARATATHTSGFKNICIAYDGVATNLSTGSVRDVRGGVFQAYNLSSGPVTNLIGVIGYAESDGSADIGAFMAGVAGVVDQEGLGTIPIAACFYGISNARGAGHITLNAGLYLEEQSGVGDSNWQLYSEGTAPSHFAGPVEIGNALNVVSPTAPDRTITLKVGGATIYVPAKTTNN